MSTIPDYITWINTNINTNGIRGITGAKLNTAFIDLINFVRAEKRLDKGIAVTENASNVITFCNRIDAVDPFPNDTTYGLILRCYDADGNNVDYKVFDMTVDGFKISPASDGFIDYLATEKVQTIPE
jgi:hypothetical protein